jgi:hypothetical protein
MKRFLVRYKTKPEKVDENAGLIANVFRELHAKAPEGVRYLVLKTDDGSFLHFVVDETAGGNPIPGLPAFQAFQSGIKERCAEPPKSAEVTVVGNYRMLGE